MSADVAPRPITERYQIQRELGRGGLAAVFQALDLATGREIALKVLTSVTDATIRLFEREYYILRSIQHPGIISVYDFGFSEHGERYYTMEILSGEDLAKLSPLPWRQACVHIRDIAAALSILHARRLLHRDVSPRNIRIDAAGQAKLLDFGALCPFGSPPDLVGTPLCMAPETVRGASVDQRADLYSLGVVLYLALTRKRPFAIRNLDDVEAATQQKPDPPSRHRAEIPPLLDQLVLSMLSADREGRPMTGAEVVDRLGAVAGLEDVAMTDVANAHLRSSALCGREREIQQIQRHIGNAVLAQGGVVVVEGESRIGKSRLVEDALVDGQLFGMTSVRVDALGHRDVLGGVAALGTKLLESLPATAREALQRHPSLSVFLLDRSSRVKHSADVQSEFVAWVVEIARRKPLLLVVDDAHTIDSASAGALGALAYQAHETGLLLLVTQLLGEPISAQLEQLTRLGARIKLRGLGTAAVRQLVQHVFGDAPNSARLAQWLEDVALGNPGQIIQLLTELVRRGVIAYSSGNWILPHAIEAAAYLPRTRRDVLEAAVQRLSELELHVGRVLALHRSPLSAAICASCLPAGYDARQLSSALDVLASHHIVNVSGPSHYIGDANIREVLLRGLTPEERNRLHLVLAHALSEAAAGSSIASTSTAHLLGLIQAGFHFMRAGEIGTGRRLLRDAGVELSQRGEELREAIPALERALEAYRDERMSGWDEVVLTVPLTLAGLYVDFRLTHRYGVVLLDLAAEATGVRLAARLERFVGIHAALFGALSIAAVRQLVSPRYRSGIGFAQSMLVLFGVGAAVTGVATALHDTPLARKVVQMLAPLRALPRFVPGRTVYELQLGLLEATLGRFVDARRMLLRVLERLRNPSLLLRQGARRQLENGVLVVLGGLDCFRDEVIADTALNELSKSRVAGSRQAAVGIRAMYHAMRGERALFERYRREVDVLAAQSGDSWRHDVLWARNLWVTHALCEDVIGLKQCLRELETLTKHAPSLDAGRQAAAALYLAFRGQPALAMARHGECLEDASRVVNELTLRFVLTLARLERLTGQAEAAERRCATALAALQPEQFEFAVSTHPVRLERVLALLDLGRAREASESCDQWTLKHAGENPLLRGLTHKTRALVALAERDPARFGAHLTQMRDWFGRCDNPSLVAQCDTVAQLGVDAGIFGSRTVSGAAASAPVPPEVNLIRGVFSRCRGSSERVQAALDIIVTHSRARQGYLYLMVQGGELKLAAPLAGVEPPEELAHELKERLDSLIRAERDASLGKTVSPEALITVIRDEHELDAELAGARCHAVFLMSTSADGTIAVGAVSLVPPADEALLEVSSAIVHEVATALYEAADVHTVHFSAEQRTIARTGAETSAQATVVARTRTRR